MPEGLFYCHEADGELVASNLSASPADVPTSICKNFAFTDFQTSPNELNKYYDRRFVSDYLQPAATNQIPPLPAILKDSDDSYTESELLDMGNSWLNPERVLNPPYGTSGNSDVTPNLQNFASNAYGNDWFNKIFWPAYFSTRLFFKLSNAPLRATLSLPDALASNFLSIHFRALPSGSREITTQILINDDAGETFETQLVGSQQSFYTTPDSQGRIAQPTPVWQEQISGSGVRTAHIASSLDYNVLNRRQQDYVLGILLPAVKNITSIEVIINDTGSDWISGLNKIIIFDTSYTEEVFPLPEGCVVPTPA